MKLPAARAKSGDVGPRTQGALQGPIPDGRHDPLIGTVIDGRYRIERLMGAGGMSRVYLGTYVKTGVQLAIKMIDLHLSGDPAMQQRSVGEARAMMSLQSGHIVHAVDVGSLDSGQLYIVMEFLDGEDLDALLAREGPLPWARVAAMGAQICSGLATAHRGGIVHRDIKPQNCFRVTIDGDPDHVKIIDFGIARDLMLEVGPTQHGFVVGTPEYMAPELLQTGVKANPRTDIYGVGVTLYKLLTGVVPYRGPDAMATLQMHVKSPLIPPSRRAPHLEIPPEADEVIGRALAKSPEARHASADELGRALRAAPGVQHSRRHAAVEAGGAHQAAAESVEDASRIDEVAARHPADGTPGDDSLRTSTLPWQAARPRGRATPPPEATRAPVEALDADRAATRDPRSPHSSGGVPGADLPAFAGSVPRPVSWRTQRIRAAMLGVVATFFILATRMVGPEAAPAPPAISGGRGVEPDAKDGAPEMAPVTRSAQGSDIPTVAPGTHTPPGAERPPEVEAPEEAPPEPRVEVPAPVLPAEAPVPGELSVVTPPEPSPAPPPAPDVTAAAVPGEQAALPEPDFHYADAKDLIDEQAGYLRSVCFSKAEKPVTRLKLRIDVRTNGRPKVRIFSGSKSVRECVRGILMFPFKPSPRGGAFEYTLAETGSSLVRVPLDPAVLQ